MQPDPIYDPDQGDVIVSWMAWGPYLWAVAKWSAATASSGFAPILWLTARNRQAMGIKNGGAAARLFHSAETAVPWYAHLTQLPIQHYLPLVMNNQRP